MQVQVNQHREILAGEAVPVPAGLERPAAAKELNHRNVGHFHGGVRHANLHHGASEVTRVERLLEHLGVADGFDTHIGTKPTGGRPDAFNRVAGGCVYGVGGSELASDRELAIIEIDRNDRGGAREPRSSDCCVTNTTATKHGNGRAP